MGPLGLLTVIGLASIVVVIRGQQCDQAIDEFHQCLRDSFGGREQSGMDELKKKADECFTSNNCDAPKPGGPRGGSQPIGQDDDRLKCFQSVGNKTRDYMLQCMRKSDPSFNFPDKDGFGGGRPGGSGRGGPKGMKFGLGGRGGPRGMAGGRQRFLLDSCKNNTDAVAKVNSCLAAVFPPKSNRDDMRQNFETHCKAKSECEAKLTTQCKEEMDRRRQSMCICGKEARAKRQEFQQQEPACSTVGVRGLPRSKEHHDCTEKPRDPCQQGFDALMSQSSSSN